jgi:hypothetical protein
VNLLDRGVHDPDNVVLKVTMSTGYDWRAAEVPTGEGGHDQRKRRDSRTARYHCDTSVPAYAAEDAVSRVV